MNSQTLDPKRVIARFDGWTLASQPLELWRDGGRLRLQELPLQILELLVRRPGDLVTREELITHLWPKGVVDFDAGLNTAMRKLRVVLGDDADAPKYIETVPRQGYRFIAPATDPAIPPTRRRSRLPLVALAAFLAGCLVLGAWLATNRAPDQRRIRVAVLPFENLSPDPANGFFTDGVHEEILSTLASRARNLEVISRTTMMMYRATPKSVSEIAAELDVTHVLEGTVRREGDKVRMTLQLIDARDDRQLWMQSFDRTLADAMTLQTEVATLVAAQLAVEFSGNAGRPAAPRNPEAYDLWLRGTLAWQGVGAGNATIKEILRVEDLFTQAIALDDSYAAAYADRARVRIAMFTLGLGSSDENVARARADLVTAEKLAGGTPLVLIRQANLAFLVDRDLERAISLIARAEDSGPLTADQLLTKANFIAFGGNIDAALLIYERAARLDPGNGAIVRFWTRTLFNWHRPAEALRVARSFEERLPGRIDIGASLFTYTGSTAQWRVDVERSSSTPDSAARLSAECELLRFENRNEELRTMLDGSTGTMLPQSSFHGNLWGSTLKPSAAFRGWERLIAGDTTGAALDGSILLEFVSNEKANEWNAWWLTLLKAEAEVFKGEGNLAAADARLALTLLPESPVVAPSLYGRILAARIFAWAGAENEAMELLDTLAKGSPGVGPAEISRDPLYQIPLRSNPRYQALVKELEAAIASNHSLESR